MMRNAKAMSVTWNKRRHCIGSYHGMTWAEN